MPKGFVMEYKTKLASHSVDLNRWEKHRIFLSSLLGHRVVSNPAFHTDSLKKKKGVTKPGGCFSLNDRK